VAKSFAGKAESRKSGHARLRYRHHETREPTSTSPQSPNGSRQLMNALQPGSYLLLQPARCRTPTARQRANHHLFGPIQLPQHRARDMPQSARNPMPFDSRTYRLPDN
jgi:hypothetical protein